MTSTLKSISCFNFSEYENGSKEIIEFKPNDNLDNSKISPCQYFTLLPETAQTIRNTPWEAKPFPFSVEVLRPDDDMESIIQIILVDGGWRRRLFNNRLETWWGKWINIDKTLDFIRTADESIRKDLAEKWNRYMVIDENYPKNRGWAGGITTIDKIIEEIKTGTAKIYRNKFVKI
jgi:hypothetical protein